MKQCLLMVGHINNVRLMWLLLLMNLNLNIQLNGSFEKGSVFDSG